MLQVWWNREPSFWCNKQSEGKYRKRKIEAVCQRYNCILRKPKSQLKSIRIGERLQITAIQWICNGFVFLDKYQLCFASPTPHLNLTLAGTGQRVVMKIKSCPWVSLLLHAMISLWEMVISYGGTERNCWVGGEWGSHSQ